MRPVVALAGVAALTAALAACGGGGDNGGGGSSGGGKTLHMLIGANTQYPEEFAAWQKSISDKFKAQTGATVQFETFASANDELTKIQTSVVSGTGPDLYAVGTTMTPTAYSTGAFVKLSDAEWQKIGGKDKFVPATLGISGPDDKNQVGIPWVSRPFVMAYNTDLLKAAGISKPATTWDDLAKQAKQMTKSGQWGLAVAYKDNFDPWKFAWQMSIQAGNPLVDGKTAKIQDPTTKKAYQTYFGWLTNDKIVDPAAIGWTNAQAVAAFAKGNTGYFMLTTPTAINSLNQGAVKGKWKFALLPLVPPGATSRPANGAEAASKSVATPFTGAWSDIQLALTNVAVQSLPDLSKGSVSDAQLDSRLAAAQKSAQSSLDRAK
jgi:multiple sugar transport system substrate-binding protein